ncbi:Uncharacterised protein [Corynebacterium striatum]|nr:Uncharacterised protein [Corynebacterium striatum]
MPVMVRSATDALLRARGGISVDSNHGDHATVSSPRTRRYFREKELRVGAFELFSAHAEVFPYVPASDVTVTRT